jgi:hypothetical protein
MSGGDTIGEGVVAGSASGAIEDAIHASKRRKKNRKSAFESPTPEGVCSNCETQLSGPVCHSCGQTSDTFHRPVWELFSEVIDGLFGVEGRLWRTLPPLMFRPGHLTRQYLSGVRMRYVLPFRLYLTASVLFFLIIAATGSFAPDTPTLDAEDAAAGEEAQEEFPSGVRDGFADSQLSEAGREEIEATVGSIISGVQDVTEDGVEAPPEDWRESAKLGIRQALLPEDFPDVAEDGETDVVPLDDGLNLTIDDTTEWPRWLREKFADQADSIIDDDGQQLAEEMQRWAPRLMFLMLPIYALLLAVTHFYKRGYFFYDHLVVSLHFHAFLFFFFLMLMGLSSLGIDATVLGLGFVLWSNYYLYRIHRLVYRHGRFSSILRTLFMDIVYSIILSIGMTVLLLIGIMAA